MHRNMTIQITILVYFLVVLGVGVYSAFKIKKPADYYVAGKNAGVLQVTGSLLATILGGSAILGTIELSQQTGWPALWFLFCASFGLFMLLPISKKVKRFGNFTLPELLGSFFGKNAETIASVVIPIAWTGVVAAQVIASAKILSGLGFISYSGGALLAGSVFIIYTLIGGQLSILKTDLFQSIIIIVAFSALVWFSFHQQGISETLSLKPFVLFSNSFTIFDLVILVLTYSVTFVVGPDIYSRLFCAKNETTAKTSTFIVALLLVPVSFALTYLGVFSADFENEGIVTFAQHLLPNWAYGLFIAALLSAVMSSADTTLLTSSMILSELVTGNLNKNEAFKTTRFFVVGIGVISILIALFVTSVIQALLFALTIFSGAFIVPVIAGLLRLKVNRKNVSMAILAGGIIALTGKSTAVFYHEFSGNIIIISSYLVNALLLFIGKKD